MKCPECNSPMRVLETRTRDDRNAIRRKRECDRGHRTTTYEISERVWRSAKFVFEKRLQAQPFWQARDALADQVQQMRKLRREGVSCPELARRFNVSLHMARYYTRLPRRSLYPNAKS